MFEELLPDFFRLETPLPGSPLKAVNVYLVRGERHLLIDNGFNHPLTEQSLLADLRALKADFGRMDFLLTHLHSDHNGLISKLLSRAPGAKVLMGRKDGEPYQGWLADKTAWKRGIFQRFIQYGFPEEERGEIRHPGLEGAPDGPFFPDFLEDGDRLSYGPYTFTVVETPGHTPGQITLYEASRRFYISGDHILGDITPNITAWGGVEDSLGDYLRSLDKVGSLPIERSFPGHRRMIPDTAGRIGELKRHHAVRLEEVLDILRRHGQLDVYQVARRMTWAMRGKNWDEYPLGQKPFAAGEAKSHLDHLKCQGQVFMEERGGILRFAIRN
ncbi:MAG: MBL fold metallo-hydrolase [Desulfovibrionaceae bacterium]|nr:MBL fold metallo-hydrolase [Desulfovibrionaceae bacterium]